MVHDKVIGRLFGGDAMRNGKRRIFAGGSGAGRADMTRDAEIDEGQ